MADPSTLRSRRHRAHSNGDHSLCKPERCPEAPRNERDEPGEIEAALMRYLGTLELPKNDPRSLLAPVAQRLARSLDTHPTASLARELRGTVLVLHELEADDGEDPAGAMRMLAQLRSLMA